MSINPYEGMGIPANTEPVTPKQLRIILEKMIHLREPVLIVGAPGIGKSDICRQATEAQEEVYGKPHDLIITHPVVDDPTNYKGMPAVVNVDGDFMAKWLPFDDTSKMINADKPTVVVLDDLGQAPAAVQAACMQLLLARRIGEFKVSDHVTFLAATNGKNHRAGVSGILEPVKSRFSSILWLVPDAQDWMMWAAVNDMPDLLVAFIGYKQELLLSWTPTPDITNQPSPRTVAALGRLMKQNWSGVTGQGALIEQAVYTSAVGRAFAMELIAFGELQKDLPDPERALKEPDLIKLPNPNQNPGAAYLFLTSLAFQAAKPDLPNKVITANMRAVVSICDRWKREFKMAEFPAMLVKICTNRNSATTQTPAFREWLMDNREIMM